jgi:hypothetical protein
MSDTLGLINKLNPVTYNWKREAKLDDTMHYGVIAQEIQEVFPTLVYEDQDKHLNVRRDEMQFILIKAVKELNVKNDLLKKETDELKAINGKLIKRIENLEKK